MTGSCTACIVALGRDSRMIYAANLGDSGFMVVRDNKVGAWMFVGEHGWMFVGECG